MLTFEECRCVTKEGRDWIAEFVVDLEEPGEEPFVVSYCPPCAEREFERALAFSNT